MYSLHSRLTWSYRRATSYSVPGQKHFVPQPKFKTNRILASKLLAAYSCNLNHALQAQKLTASFWCLPPHHLWGTHQASLLGVGPPKTHLFYPCVLGALPWKNPKAKEAKDAVLFAMCKPHRRAANRLHWAPEHMGLAVQNLIPTSFVLLFSEDQSSLWLQTERFWIAVLVTISVGWTKALHSMAGSKRSKWKKKIK